MTTKKGFDFKPAYWAVLIFIVAQLLTFLTISRENEFLEVNHIFIPPQPPSAITLWPTPEPVIPTPPGEIQAPTVGSLGPILIYFAAVVIILGVVLFVVPVSALRLILRVLFAVVFSWALFVVLIFWLPAIPTSIISVAIGFAWFFLPRVWLHNLVMILAMVSLGAVFGHLITPWTTMILILALGVYDFLAVRFGYMLWMTKKMTESSTLPAFVIPRYISEWNSSLKQAAFIGLVEENPFDRKYSILGGGDIGFPVLLVASVYFGYGLPDAILVAAFSLFGLICAYWIQAAFLKGRPVPALPPIAVLSLIALLIVR